MDNNDFTVIVHTLFFHLFSFGLEYHLSLYDNKKQNQDLARLSLGILTCDAFKSELLMPMEVWMGEGVKWHGFTSRIKYALQFLMGLHFKIMAYLFFLARKFYYTKMDDFFSRGLRHLDCNYH